MEEAPSLSTYSQRIAKLERLRAKGIDPYPSTSGRTHVAGDIHAHFQQLEDRQVTLAGRLMSVREHGRLVFAHLQDQSGTVQLMIAADKVLPTDVSGGRLGFQDAMEFLDTGDLVEATGTVTKTRRGEVSIAAVELRLLAKAIQSLPDKWHGIRDEELLVRKRYLDLIMNPDKRHRFESVSRILLATRNFLDAHDFLEFQTPVLQPLYGGGRARPFRTHVRALSSDYYLAISHELYLKRLVIAGFERVYTIGRYFRNEGIDRTHNPEFSMLETMTAFEGYEYNMDLTEELYKHLAKDVVQKPKVAIRGHVIDLLATWRRASMADLVRDACQIDFRSVTDVTKANLSLQTFGLASEPTVGHAMVALFEEVVAPTLIQPTIVYGHPVEISPLAKAVPEDPRFVERFELYIGGTEQGDNWSELNDPVELRARFMADQERRSSNQDEEAHPVDFEFIEALEYGMPPTTGVGPGIERLAMLLTEADSISDVMFFPLLRPIVGRGLDEPEGESSNRDAGNPGNPDGHLDGEQ